MKTGRCPRCKFRMVVVRLARCGCGRGHRQIIQGRGGGCSNPVFELFVRTHRCGRRLRPTRIEALEMRTA